MRQRELEKNDPSGVAASTPDLEEITTTDQGIKGFVAEEVLIEVDTTNMVVTTATSLDRQGVTTIRTWVSKETWAWETPMAASTVVA